MPRVRRSRMFQPHRGCDADGATIRLAAINPALMICSCRDRFVSLRRPLRSSGSPSCRTRCSSGSCLMLHRCQCSSRSARRSIRDWIPPVSRLEACFVDVSCVSSTWLDSKGASVPAVKLGHRRFEFAAGIPAPGTVATVTRRLYKVRWLHVAFRFGLRSIFRTVIQRFCLLEYDQPQLNPTSLRTLISGGLRRMEPAYLRRSAANRCRRLSASLRASGFPDNHRGITCHATPSPRGRAPSSRPIAIPGSGPFSTSPSARRNMSCGLARLSGCQSLDVAASRRSNRLSSRLHLPNSALRRPASRERGASRASPQAEAVRHSDW